MSKNKFVDLPIGNYYGGLEAYEKDGVFYLNLDNYDGSNEKWININVTKLVKAKFDNKEFVI